MADTMRPRESGTPAPMSSTSAARSYVSDPSFRRLKSDHLKRAADDMLKRGDYRGAYQKYTECLDIAPEGAELYKLHSNRAQAYLKASRYEQALSDAVQCNDLAPEFAKGWWRKAQAHMGLKDFPAAMRAFKKGSLLEPDNKEWRKQILQTARHFTREMIGEWILDVLEEYEEDEILDAPEHETVSRIELKESLFRHIHEWHHDKPQPGDYTKYLVKWVLEPMTPGMAYIHRSVAHRGAKCYLQAAADATQAVHYYLREKEHDKELSAHRLTHCEIDKPGTTRHFKWVQLNPLAMAWFYKGEALQAETKHPDQDWVQATKCFMHAVDVEPDNKKYQASLSQAGEFLNNSQMSGVLNEVYNAGKANPITLGILEEPEGDDHIFRVHAVVYFPGAKPRDFSAKARDTFRTVVAERVGLGKLKVLIEKVRPPAMVVKDGLPPALEIAFQIQLGGNKEKGEEYCKEFEKDVAEAVGGYLVVEHLGEPDRESASARVEDITPEKELPDDVPDGRGAGDIGTIRANGMHDTRITVAPRPKLDMELPYRMYKLVHTDGRPAERVNKHAFSMSRAYYSETELPDPVWAEISDGSCRWRQSTQEVSIICLRVPPELTKRDLVVKIEMRSLYVGSKDGEVFFEGELFRAIIPEESVWVAGGGKDADGFMFFLKKMNLELMKDYDEHTNMWWEKLFTHQYPIAWDDYEKDYSDLPAPLERRRKFLEGKRDMTNRIEAAEKQERDNAQERDDIRKRNRQERLAQLRGNAYRNWVYLERDNPSEDPLKMGGGGMGGRDSGLVPEDGNESD